MTDKNPFEDISTDLLAEDFADAIHSLNELIEKHKLIIAGSQLLTTAQLLEGYASLVQYLEMLGLQVSEGSDDQVLLGHLGLHQGCFGKPSSLLMSVSSLFTSGTAASSLLWVICADCAVSVGIFCSTFCPNGDS